MDMLASLIVAMLALITGNPDEAIYDASRLSVFRVELMTPGGSLPFILTHEDKSTFWHSAPIFKFVIWNGEEQIVISEENTQGEIKWFGGEADVLAKQSRYSRYSMQLSFQEYDSTLSWHRWYGSRRNDNIETGHEGAWRKWRGDAYVEIPVIVTELRDRPRDLGMARFEPLPSLPEWDENSADDFNGRWRVEFESADEPAIGLLEVDENQIATGTFLTTTGDYRYLAGRVDGPYLRLSTFDGAHAFLFHARMQDDGSIQGDFWSGNWHHETWTAVRDDDAQLPDAFEQTSIADEQKLEELVFKDTEGNPTRVLDALDKTNAKARVIEIFGTWCPNCADASRELVSLRQKYGDGLGVVGLAFEITEDFERSAQQVKRHHEHIGSDWQVLIAGLSDKEKATQTLGFLDRVRSYPTLVFLDSDNEVQAVYSGFSGPATGDAYKDQRLRFEALIEALIEEE